MIGTAVIALAPVATATASAAPASSARGTAQAAKGCLAVTATVPVGLFPRGVAVNQKTGTIYVANLSGNTVSVINGGDRRKP